ncbi:MAG: hypothetical protein H6739_32445 [Alphaproteobacteria bacterium]|nr:hypothetical protein [Alphaproteobacteria bacterium]
MRRSILSVVVLGLAAGCDPDGKTPEPTWCAPVVDVLAPTAVALGQSVTLDASGSATPEECATDGPLRFTWTLDAAPEDSSLDETIFPANDTPDASTVTFAPDAVGAWLFLLEVCDDTGCSDPEGLILEVAAGTEPPVADAGPDVEATVGERASLDGTGSYDPEGAELEWSWALSAAPTCSELGPGDLFDPGSPQATILCDCAGAFVVQLVVSDGLLTSAPDYAVVTCMDVDEVPVADAGDNESLALCPDEPIPLSGYGSYDPDGADLTYRWTALISPDGMPDDARFDDLAAPTPRYDWSGQGAGEYVFQLEVFDGIRWSPPDIVSKEVSQRQGCR